MITQVFPYGSVELMHPERGRFKVNGQRVKIYLGRQFRKHTSITSLNPVIRNAWEHEIFVGQQLLVVGHQLGGHSLVELTTVNKALLGRQPKPLNVTPQIPGVH